MGVSVSASGAAAKTASFTLGPDVKVLTEDGRQVAPGSGRGGRPGARRAQPARVLQGRGEVGAHLQGDRRRALLHPRRLRPGRRRRDHPPAGPGSVCINSGGEKIFPEEVEEALKTHPAVRDAVVVGVPAPDLRRADRGRGRAASDGAAEPAEAELIAHVKERLASYKAPRRVRSVATIGRAANGKVDYRRHRAESMDELGSPPADGLCGLCGAGRAAEPDWAHVHRAGRRHPRRGRVAPLRRLPSLRPPGRAGRPGRGLPVVVPTQFVLEERHGVAAPGAGQPGVRRTGREPSGAAERGRRLGLHPVVVEGDRRRGPRPRDPHDLLRRGAAGRHGDGARRADGSRAAWPPFCGASWRRSSPTSTWPTRARPTRRSCSGSSESPSRSSRCRPSSSTAATSTSRTAGPWWSVCDERGAPG